MNEPSGSLATLRRWVKWTRDAKRRAIAGTSFWAPAPSEPAHSVKPFDNPFQVGGRRGFGPFAYPPEPGAAVVVGCDQMFERGFLLGRLGGDALGGLLGVRALVRELVERTVAAHQGRTTHVQHYMIGPAGLGGQGLHVPERAYACEGWHWYNGPRAASGNLKLAGRRI